MERNANGRFYHMDLQWRLFYNRVNARKRPRVVVPLQCANGEKPFEMCMINLRVEALRQRA